jgi:Flp pilus assembly protein TadB
MQASRSAVRLGRLWTRAMRAALFIIFWLLAVVAVAALLIAHMLRTVDERKKSGSHRIDSEAHRRSAENAAEVEAHDIDDMLDAINERRRRAGRREIGEELADELMRSTWDDRA